MKEVGLGGGEEKGRGVKEIAVTFVEYGQEREGKLVSPLI